MDRYLKVALVVLMQCSLVLTLKVAGQAQMAGRSSGSLTKVRVAIPTRTVTLLSVLRAVDQGLYQKEGLQVILMQINPALSTKALLTGDIDYSTVVGSPTRAAAMGAPLKLIFTLVNKPIWYLMTTPRIRSVKDLKGKPVGVTATAGTTDYGMREILKHHGLDPDKDVTRLAIGSDENIIMSLKAGSIEAGLVALPWNTKAKQLGLKELLFAGDVIDLPMSGLATSDRKIREQPGEIKGMIRATIRSTIAILDHRDEMIDYIGKNFGLDRAVATGAFDTLSKVLRRDAGISPEAIKANLLVATEPLKLKEEVPLSKVSDFRLLEEVRRELGLAR